MEGKSLITIDFAREEIKRLKKDLLQTVKNFESLTGISVVKLTGIPDQGFQQLNIHVEIEIY